MKKGLKIVFFAISPYLYSFLIVFLWRYIMETYPFYFVDNEKGYSTFANFFSWAEILLVPLFAAYWFWVGIWFCKNVNKPIKSIVICHFLGMISLIFSFIYHDIYNKIYWDNLFYQFLGEGFWRPLAFPSADLCGTIAMFVIFCLGYFWFPRMFAKDDNS